MLEFIEMPINEILSIYELLVRFFGTDQLAFRLKKIIQKLQMISDLYFKLSMKQFIEIHYGVLKISCLFFRLVVNRPFIHANVTACVLQEEEYEAALSGGHSYGEETALLLPDNRDATLGYSTHKHTFTVYKPHQSHCRYL